MAAVWPLVLLILSGSALRDEVRPLQDGPIDFRCDSMQIFTDPHRVLCRTNVVVRRANLFICCDQLEGYSNAKGDWERLVCRNRVRAQRGDEIMWSKQATFVTALHDLVLTGQPILRRGQSILSGERIVVDTKHDRAHVEKPTGRVQQAPAAALPPLPLEGPLPDQCPMTEAPPPTP